ncbi:hypothetical protein FHL15_008174 [Xylaria flabelliformis]|uniref:FAD/NAD(P)-binding domain-containing protein n=1 Tax=Xylaria flabelliformis TaxID=2512241 RepID=A0A553HSN7_9PEZI|nr:hypothetical protein FHL15_008174 [Xylaria flabelliformis]
MIELKSRSGIPDVIIIGGSHTGLSAALTLYRSLHTCLIFDSGTPRNRMANHVHMVPGFNDRNPNEFREVARNELLATGLVQIVPRLVVSAARLSDEFFEVIDSTGEHWKCRKILLAQGIKEKYPDIEGYAELYGKYIFHCLFCFGFEQRGANRGAVLAQGPLGTVEYATIFANDAKKFAKDVKIYTNGNTTLTAQLTEKSIPGVEIDDRKLKRVYKTPNDKLELIIQFDQGPDDVVGFLANQPEMPIDRTLVDQLGCEVVATGIKVNAPFNSTTAPGVFAAGDCISQQKSILNGLAAGSNAGVGIARELPVADAAI